MLTPSAEMSRFFVLNTLCFLKTIYKVKIIDPKKPDFILLETQRCLRKLYNKK